MKGSKAGTLQKCKRARGSKGGQKCSILLIPILRRPYLLLWLKNAGTKRQLRNVIS